MDSNDNDIIKDAFHTLFTGLSTWEPCGDLVLDISVYSPSDDKHWFKYLTFCSDTELPKCPSEHELHDPGHGWTDGHQTKAPTDDAIECTFDEIMEERPFPDEPAQMEWWRNLPSVPVVGMVLLRQQTRRRWKQTALANMFTRFPNMKNLSYEPWREWDDINEIHISQRTQTLIESFASTQLRNLTIFENFNETYPQIYSTRSFPVADIRVPDPAVSKRLARASLNPETLSASFMVDASYFFESYQESWRWNKLTSLALTSGTLTSDANPEDINRMLQSAAEAALQMPKLNTMEIWNGRRGVAMVFQYEKARDGQPAMVTVRGTWELDLSPAVKEAWDRVTPETVSVQSSLIDPSMIQCHGDAICQLGLSTEVVRPVSLQQILIEDQLRAK